MDPFNNDDLRGGDSRSGVRFTINVSKLYHWWKGRKTMPSKNETPGFSMDTLALYASYVAMLPTLINTIIEMVKKLEVEYNEAKAENAGASKKQILMATLQGIIANEDIWKLKKESLSNWINFFAKILVGASGKDPEPAPES